MAKKKKTKKTTKKSAKKHTSKKSHSKSKEKKIDKKKYPTLNLKTEHDIAMDFATKVYKQFNKIVKSVILFGSTTKQTASATSDIDIVIIIDDASIKWDQELIAWYRQELDKIIKSNPYAKELHINTTKLTIWWEDLMRGDPLVLNVLRYGEAMVDLAGFFNPLKHLLIAGKIRSTPEAIYSCLQRAPQHLARSKIAELGAVEGLFWTMVDSAHAALIAAHVSPPSPEHIPGELKDTFVVPGKLKPKYVQWFRDLNALHKKISHKEVADLKGVEIDMWQERTEEFLSTMAILVKDLVDA